MVYYTGKDDPVQHLQWFEDAVSIRPMTDAFKCRLFAITLKEKARDWFHQLPPRSIFGFEDLSRSFQLRFSTSKKRKKGPESLFLIKQRAEESLAHYVDRFQEEVLDIQEVPGYALQMAFTVGLREGFFKMSLTRKTPLSFEELMERAAEEIAMEAANPAFVKKLARLTEVESKEQGGSRHHEGRRREEHRAQGSRDRRVQSQAGGSREDLPMVQEELSSRMEGTIMGAKGGSTSRGKPQDNSCPHPSKRWRSVEGRGGTAREEEE
ncbi:hypothetical protein KSP39_PZI015058 [Platanthera zijinensis]|uniref:Retrotransposon gag domain-containing protein n=1 Tax=Platanthera zijinensis TaxID=2320716 RepID=A0AAP0G2Q8_9ASPA